MTDNMKAIYDYIQTHPNTNREKIAEDFYVSTRFVACMVTLLRRSGYISSEQAKKILHGEGA